jgi:outer membrane protein TolC
LRTVAALSVLLVASTCVANGAAGAQTLPTVPTVPASPIPSAQVPLLPQLQPYRAPVTPLPTAGIAGVTEQPFVGISADDAVQMALMRGTDLAISQSDRRVAGYQIVAAQGAYDVRFQIQPSYNYQVSAPLSPFESGPGNGAITQTTVGLNGSFSGQLPGGTQYSLGLSGQGIRSNNTSNGFNPYLPTAVSFDLTQPLLRGQYSAARRQVALAKINGTAMTDTTLLQASTTIANVLDTYWDLVAAWRDVAIQTESLREAKEQSASNARLVKRGAAAPVDVVESDTQVDVYQDGVLVASLKNRPEIAQLRDQRDAAAVDVAYAKDQTKPQVDLSVGYTSNGFAGSPSSLLGNPLFAVFNPLIASTQQLINFANSRGAHIAPFTIVVPTTPANFNGNIGTSLNNLLQNKLPAVAIAATIGLPLRNRTARANYAVALEQQRALELQQVALIQRLAFESRNAVQDLASARSRLIAARAARVAAGIVYASELRKFHAGASTTFLVLQRQTELANQRGRELRAQTDLNKAVVELQRVSGTILTQHDVAVNALAGTPAAKTTLPAPPSPAPTPILSPLP